MQNKGSKEHSVHLFFWLLFLHSPGCHGNTRERRGVEDTFIGPCHREGVGWRGQSTKVVDRSDMFKYAMPVHWTRLVDRPDCVDKIEIFMNDYPMVQEEDPTDRDLLSFDVGRNVCNKETMKMIVYNRRGGLKEDEEFTYITELYGVSKPDLFFQTERMPDHSPTRYGKVTLYLTRYMFKDRNMEKCLTNIEVKTMNNGTYKGIQDKVIVYVNICEDEIITIEYHHYITIF